MEIFRPLQISCNQRTLEQNRQFYWVVSATMGIRISSGDPILEMDFIKEAIESMGDTPMPDIGMPKPTGEFLLNGHFHAPNNEPVRGGDVSVKIGNVEKTIRILGPRHWSSLGTTQQQAITQHWIDYSSAYGGNGYPQNPTGMGYQGHELPLQEYPNQLVTSAKSNAQPASFGPLDITWPQRSQFQGTYDQHYMQKYFPGFPSDTDWKYFLCAAPDQWNNQHWRGDETFELHNLSNMNSSIHGKLPNFNLRCFINESLENSQNEHSAETLKLEELSLKLDTVWFFPDSDLIQLTWRGGKSVSDDDASQIKHLLLAYETHHQRKDTAYYQEAFAKRLQSNDALFKSINAFDLVPNEHKSALELFKEKAIDAEADGNSSALAKNLENKSSEIKTLMNEKLHEGKEELIQNISKSDHPIVQGINPDELVHPPEQPKNKLAAALDKVLPGMSAGDLTKLDLRKFTSDTMEQIQSVFNEFDAQQKLEAKKLLAEKIKQTKAILSSPDLHQPASLPSKTSTSNTSTQHADSSNSNVDKEAVLAQLAQMEKMVNDEVTEGPLPRLDATEMINNIQARMTPEIDSLKQRLLTLTTLKSSSEKILAAQDQLNDLVQFQENLIETTLKKMEGDFYQAYKMGAEYMPSGLSPHTSNEDRKAEFLQRISQGKSVSRMDWACLDLSNLNLDGIDLSHCLFEQCQFNQSILKNCNLTSSILVRCQLQGANLTGADLTEANLGDSDCSHATFSFAKCNHTVFNKSNLEQAKFEGATLDECSMLDAQLKQTDLTNSDIKKMQLLDMSIDAVSLQSANLTDSTFVNCTLSHLNAEKANLPSTTWINCELVHSNFNQANLDKNSFVGTDERPIRIAYSDFKNASMNFSNFQSARLTQCQFNDANMNNANFSNAQWVECQAHRAQAKQALFRKAQLQHSEWQDANLMEAIMTKADISSANFYKANMYAVDFIRATVGETNFKAANLDATLLKDWRPS